MEASKIKSLVLFMCLLLVFQNGKLVVFVKSQYTNPIDVLGISTLQLTFPQLIEAADDPCYPVKLTWVECNNDYLPRITALNLGGKNLIGLLPDFSYYLDALEIIDVHDNSLSGPIPIFLGSFLYLTKLDLSDNLFTGTIPSSLANNKNLVKNFSGNPGLNSGNTSPPGSSTSPPSGGGSSYFPPPTTSSYNPSFNYTPKSKKKTSKLPIIFGAVGGTGLVSSIVGAIAIRKQKQRTAAAVAAGNINVGPPIVNQSGSSNT